MVKIDELGINDIVMLQGNPISVTVKHDVDTTIPITEETIEGTTVRRQQINYAYALEYYFLNVYEGLETNSQNNNAEYIAFYDDSVSKTTESKTIDSSNVQTRIVSEGSPAIDKVESIFNIVIDNLSYDAIVKILIYIVDDNGTISSEPVYSSNYFYALYNGDPIINIHNIGWERSNIQVVNS